MSGQDIFQSLFYVPGEDLCTQQSVTWETIIKRLP